MKIFIEFCIFDIRISLGTRFQLKVTILIFFYEICPKREFPVENGKITLVRAFMVVTYYVQLLLTRADRHNSILMSLLILFAVTISLSSNVELFKVLMAVSNIPFKPLNEFSKLILVIT